MKTVIYQVGDLTKVVKCLSIENNRDYSIKYSKDIPDEFDVKRSKRRAFANAKDIAMANPFLTKFVTFTYADNMQDYQQLLSDMKSFVRTERRTGNNLQFIWVVEKQKRGALHVHMICNNALSIYKNKNGFDSLIHWPHGYTSVLDVKNTDENFKPYLYLLKYMGKSKKIGGQYIHTSRGLKRFTKNEDTDILDLPINLFRRIIHQESNQIEVYPGLKVLTSVTYIKDFNYGISKQRSITNSADKKGHSRCFYSHPGFIQ